MIKGWGSEGFLRSKAFYDVKGVGRDPRGRKICVAECVSLEEIRIYLV